MTAPQNPVRAGNPGVRDLPHRVATRGTSQTASVVWAFSEGRG